MASSTLGNLGVEITARANQFLAELVKSEAAMNKFQRSISKTVTKAGLDVVGMSNAARVLSSELRYVFESVEKIPGVNPASVASIVEMRAEVEAFRNAVHRLTADGIALFSDFSKSLGMMGGAMADAFSRLSIMDLLFNPTKVAAEFAMAMTVVDDVIKREIATTAEAARQQNALALSTMTAAKASKEYEAAAARIIKADEWRAAIHRGFQAELQKEAETIRGQSLPALDRYGEAVRRAQVLLGHGKLTQEEFARAVAAASAEYEEANEKTSKLARGAQDLGFAFESAFESAILQGEKLSTVLQGLAQDVLRIALREAITKPLGGAIAGMVGGLFGGKRAAGGPVDSGRPYLVGEQGPELMVPKTAGTIVPNHRLGAAGGGNNFYIDARSADRTGLTHLEGLIRQINGSIEHRAVYAIMDWRRRGRG